MSGPKWDNEAWQQIRDYEEFWAPFDTVFTFRAGMDPDTWPAIIEPSGSIVFDLSPVFGRTPHGFEADANALDQQVLMAMTAAFATDTPLVALDWQHTSYWFWPHRQSAIEEPWRITPFPNGDYHAFVTPDFEQGTFGHPWEQTICLFGAHLVQVLAPLLAEWLPVQRRN